ncbi:MAG TPA: ferritin-like domain-containing protein [Burkholderiaceae bacterium]|nr:ferritin-like domain-containing protein [Burkholderiaceae bacterium]
MNDIARDAIAPSREQLVHALYEAAELEHNLMCTYLYAAFSLKSGEEEGLTAEEAAAVQRWRRVIGDVAVEEMSHLAAVWNITSALGGAPRIGRANFPLDPGYLPAGVVVKLAPFSEATLQHFIHLERPDGSREPDGDGFAPERSFLRASVAPRLTPMGLDYETVGAFYAALGDGLRGLVAGLGEQRAFCGDRALQLSQAELDLPGARPVICIKTALAAFDAIVLQGEGAPKHTADSHFAKFVSIRTEYRALRARNPGFAPAYPAATNPVLRRPPRPEGRVWIDNEQAAATVDIANATYALMLRLLAYAYMLRGSTPEKASAVDLAIGLMRAFAVLAERAARLPAGPSNPNCNAGVSFTALRDAAALPVGASAWRFFVERFEQLADAAQSLAVPGGDARATAAARQLSALTQRAAHVIAAPASDALPAAPAQPSPPARSAAPASSIVDGVERVEGERLALMFEGGRCIHARFCVTGAPAVFLANVKGAWLYPDAMDVARVVEVAHACPSGAIRYLRKDGGGQESAPPVNLAAVREGGPYAFRGDLRIDGVAAGYRATLCRCGASKNKPFCDGSHHDAGFAASGEPPTRDAEMLAGRDGPLAIDPQPDGPLRVRGNLEVVSGTGRVVARVTSANFCRCGASQSKPFCDGSHARIGFKSG